MGFHVRVYGLGSDGIAPPPPAPTPAPSPTPEPQVHAASIPEIICSMPWPCGEALRVATCESGLAPDAVNPWSGAAGLFQLLMEYHRWRLGGGSEFDPVANTRAAYSLWLERGWQPWIVGGCSPY